MTRKIKVGQRIRAEWLHGAAVENEVYTQLGTQKLVFDIPGLGGVLTVPIDELPSSVKVTVLDDPKPLTGVVNPDRRVHAVLDDHSLIVRYDRAGKWFHEKQGEPRRKIDITTAARLAARRGEKVSLGLPGGTTFDALVRRIREGKIE